MASGGRCTLQKVNWALQTPRAVALMPQPAGGWRMERRCRRRHRAATIELPLGITDLTAGSDHCLQPQQGHSSRQVAQRRRPLQCGICQRSMTARAASVAGGVHEQVLNNHALPDCCASNSPALALRRKPRRAGCRRVLLYPLASKCLSLREKSWSRGR